MKRAVGDQAIAEAGQRSMEVLEVHAELGRALAHLDQVAEQHAEVAERVTDLEGRLRGLARTGHKS